MAKQFTRTEIREKLISLVKEIMQDDAIEIDTSKSLFEEYSLDSLDLLDLSFNIEELFGVKIGANELRGQAKDRMKEDDMIDENGYITQKALDGLKAHIPEIPAERFNYGLRQEDIPRLLNIDIFIRMIFDKIQGV